MAAVLQYITAEVLELAGDICTEQRMKTIQPRHINLAFRGDPELGQMMASCTMTQSSVPPNVHEALQKGKGGKGKKKTVAS